MTRPFYVDQIAGGILANHLATPMTEVFSVSPTDSASRTRRELDHRQFDVAPVVKDGRVIGLVVKDDLCHSGTISAVTKPLHDGSVISGDVGLPDLLAYLQLEPVLFVLEGRSIAGLVTPTDLGRPAARTYFYLLLAQLEIALAELVRRLYPDQSRALGLLTPARRAGIEKLSEDLRQKDQFIDTIAALMLTDLLKIVGADPSRRSRYVEGTWSWGPLQSELGPFRNDVMHPVRDFREATPEGMRSLHEQALKLLHLIDVTTSLVGETHGNESAVVESQQAFVLRGLPTNGLPTEI